VHIGNSSNTAGIIASDPVVSESQQEVSACSLKHSRTLELSTAYFQLVNSDFLSQQISQRYFQPLIFSQANKLGPNAMTECALPLLAVIFVIVTIMLLKHALR
jgi:hypothetical protein